MMRIVWCLQVWQCIIIPSRYWVNGWTSHHSPTTRTLTHRWLRRSSPVVTTQRQYPTDQILHQSLSDEQLTKKSDVYIITGSNGYIGRAIVHELLHHKTTTTTTTTTTNDNQDDVGTSSNRKTSMIVCLVRSHHVDREQSYWLQQQQQHDTETSSCAITVLPYDMLDGGKSFQSALDHVWQHQDISSICVFHVASVFGPTDRFEQTAMENVNGTVDLIHTYGTALQRLKHSNDSSTHIKLAAHQCKFILTSSMAAVRGTGQVPLNQKYYTNLDWNTNSNIYNDTIRTNANWGTYYQWSKMESERQAWELCQHQWSDCLVMTALCPSFVFGPLMDSSAQSSTSSSYSITLVDQWIRGISPVQSRLFVDVRDVAKAHVMAAINDAAIGQRIILSTESRISSQDIAQWIKGEINRCNLPIDIVDPNKVHYDAEFQGGSIPIGNKEVDATDALQRLLGIALRPVKDTIVDMTQILLSASES